MYFKRGDTQTPILLFVDILSRKAFAYILPNSKESTRGNYILNCIEDLNNNVNGINGLIGDNEFNNKIIKTYCNDNNIRLDTSVAKTEHISNGDKLGIIDRFCRTLRQLINRYYEITGHKKDNIKEVIKYAIETYNNNFHRTLKETPNEAWTNNNIQIAHHLSDIMYNQSIFKSIPIKEGQLVRILEDKDTFSKGHHKFSVDLYKVDNKVGYKITVKDDDGKKLNRQFKPSELLKINKVDNPISKQYIDEEKEDKKKGKIINSLITNAKMTPIQAQQAVAAVNEPKQKRSTSAPIDYSALAGINRRKK